MINEIDIVTYDENSNVLATYYIRQSGNEKEYEIVEQTSRPILLGHLHNSIFDALDELNMILQNTEF